MTPPESQDIRWQQRFSNYLRALDQLTAATLLRRSRPLSALEQQGLLKAFEFTHELAWNVLKDYLAYQGITDITGSRDAIRTAFRLGLIEDGQTWMDTIQSRNRSSHTYDEATANALATLIAERYVGLFEALRARLERLIDAPQG